MFGTSGIRGPVGEVVTADLALTVGRAVGVETDRVVVGRDPRASGRLLVDALTAGLRELGTDVVDLGEASTPTVARAVAWEDCDAGVSVTASHNPAEDNGIKLWQPSGQAYDEAGRERIEDRIRTREFDLEAWDGLGERTRSDADERHVAALVDSVSVEGIPEVVVDLGNGAGTVSVEALQRLGCHVETLNGQPDGRFPGRPSEPNAETLTSLCELVGAGDASLGIAHDGDADRMMAVDEHGEFVPKDALLAILAAESTEAGERVAVPVDTSLAVTDFLAERDVAVEHTPVGDVYVAEALGGDVTFGGEPSGAWIWPDQTLCPDGPLAACRLVELAADRPLSDRIAEVPDYPIRRANVEVADKEAVMAAVVEQATEQYDERDISTIDGVRVDRGDAWFLVRASGTQPLVRVTAEARDADRAETVLAEARSLL
ncbi:phosphoglucosamine mutase [Halomarina oriensis]|uniref:Phosphoglucosamine mutase n=1 Tax=Halomarina oriensis TaxID=671145 RepID=A0A6B0GHT5_9EURY|nr:phosphoglucosamine mutase [Halomarina oriensis]MWG34426.1 phosphoglucosamine mutase [Halomarina oriensis]